MGKIVKFPPVDRTKGSFKTRYTELSMEDYYFKFVDLLKGPYDYIFYYPEIFRGLTMKVNDSADLRDTYATFVSRAAFDLIRKADGDVLETMAELSSTLSIYLYPAIERQMTAREPLNALFILMQGYNLMFFFDRKFGVLASDTIRELLDGTFSSILSSDRSAERYAFDFLRDAIEKVRENSVPRYTFIRLLCDNFEDFEYDERKVEVLESVVESLRDVEYDEDSIEAAFMTGEILLGLILDRIEDPVKLEEYFRKNIHIPPFHSALLSEDLVEGKDIPYLIESYLNRYGTCGLPPFVLENFYEDYLKKLPDTKENRSFIKEILYIILHDRGTGSFNLDLAEEYISLFKGDEREKEIIELINHPDNTDKDGIIEFCTKHGQITNLMELVQRMPLFMIPELARERLLKEEPEFIIYKMLLENYLQVDASKNRKEYEDTFTQLAQIIDLMKEKKVPMEIVEDYLGFMEERYPRRTAYQKLLQKMRGLYRLRKVKSKDFIRFVGHDLY